MGSRLLTIALTLFLLIPVNVKVEFVGLGSVIKDGLSLSEKNCFIYFNEKPLKMMKNAFHFILKAPFIPKIYKFSSWLFGHVEKRLD